MSTCHLRIFRRQLLYLYICFATGYVGAGSEDRLFEQTRLQLGVQIDLILVESKACRDVADCQRAKIAFVSPGNGGVAVQIWGDLNAAALRLIAKACSDVFFNNREISKISLEIYRMSKDDALNLPIWKFAKAEASVSYTRSDYVKR